MAWSGGLARVLAVAAIVFSTIGCDRVTKVVAAGELSGRGRISFASDVLRLEYTENRGGFLSLGAELPTLMRRATFTIGTGILLAGLGVVLFRQVAAGHWAIGPALLLAGGVGNLLDRVASGRVIDFMNVGVGRRRTGIFNVADVAITAGVLLVAAELMRSKRAEMARE